MTFRSSSRLVTSLGLLGLLACGSDGAPPPGPEGAFVPIDVVPVAGLHGIDDLPADTLLMSAPGLVDGDLENGWSSLGPSGASFQNLGFDLGQSVSVDQIRIHVRSGGGALVPFGGPVAWSVWSSSDGLSWEHVPVTSQAFPAAISAYVLTIAPTSARFFKAVSFGLNTVETFVTELQAFWRKG